MGQQVRQEAKKRKVGSKGNFCSSTMLDRGLGCMLGNVIGDALGAPLEFSPVRYGSTELKSLCQETLPSSEALSDAACATATLLGRSCGQSTELSMDEPKA